MCEFYALFTSRKENFHAHSHIHRDAGGGRPHGQRHPARQSSAFLHAAQKPQMARKRHFIEWTERPRQRHRPRGRHRQRRPQRAYAARGLVLRKCGKARHRLRGRRPARAQQACGRRHAPEVGGRLRAEPCSDADELSRRGQRAALCQQARQGNVRSPHRRKERLRARPPAPRAAFKRSAARVPRCRRRQS